MGTGGRVYLLEFDVDPVAKGRPRFTRQGHAYTPAKTRKYETELATLARHQWQRSPLEGALMVSIWVRLERPKSVRREAPTVRPDLDNYVKAVLDPLNGITWHDDAQIVSLSIVKQYAEQPGLLLQIEERP